MSKKELRLIQDALADFQDAVDLLRPFADKKTVRRWDRAADVLDGAALKLAEEPRR